MPIILSYFNFNCFTCSDSQSHINTSFKKTIEGFISENDFSNQRVNPVYKIEKNQDKNEFHFKNYIVNILLSVHMVFLLLLLILIWGHFFFRFSERMEGRDRDREWGRHIGWLPSACARPGLGIELLTEVCALDWNRTQDPMGQTFQSLRQTGHGRMFMF